MLAEQVDCSARASGCMRSTAAAAASRGSMARRPAGRCPRRPLPACARVSGKTASRRASGSAATAVAREASRRRDAQGRARAAAQRDRHRSGRAPLCTTGDCAARGRGGELRSIRVRRDRRYPECAVLRRLAASSLSGVACRRRERSKQIVCVRKECKKRCTVSAESP
jgi:hypothetical protein